MYLQDSIPLDSTNQFSKLFLDYVKNVPALDDFYSSKPRIESFKSALETKAFPLENRVVLKQELKMQYAGFDISSAVDANLGLISNQKTFTVTTGHQLCLFTGPVYFLYKIISTIKLSTDLKFHFPDYNFVPVYWMASEDHDFEEISSFNLFGKKFEWKSQQTGAVGNLITEEIKQIIDLIPESKPLFEKAYLGYKTLSEATRYLVNELFGKYGLLVIDGNSSSLKSVFSTTIQNELVSRSNFLSVVETSQNLEKLGYSLQIKPREINLFYLGENFRERIVEENNVFKVLNTDLTFTKAEILELAQTNPEKFSPNVVLRPLYQEIVLPNLAYIGGPGELAYWLQLKSMFVKNKVDFPILMPRNFAMLINENQLSKLQKLGFEPADLFKDENQLKNQLIIKKQSKVWDESVYKEELTSLFNKIKREAIEIDKSLEGFVDAQRNEGFKVLDLISKKVKKTAELKEQEGIAQLLNLKQKLFPNQTLQERTDNFLNFSLKNPDFIKELLNLFQPLQFEFNIVVSL